MDFIFKSNEIRKLCENRRYADQRLGPDCASKLRTRLADLEAATNVLELTAGRPHPLKGNRLGQYAVDLAGGKRLVFEPDHDPCPMLSTQSIDWGRVTRILIIFIGDYHG